MIYAYKAIKIPQKIRISDQQQMEGGDGFALVGMLYCTEIPYNW